MTSSLIRRTSKRAQIAVTLFGLVVATMCGNSMAQDPSANQLTTAMFDTYACSYTEGHGPADLDKVVADWNAWMAANEAEQYSAWIWAPFYFAPEDTVDFIWVGVAPDAETLERGHDDGLANGADIGSQLDQVANCDAHFNFAATNFRPAPVRDSSSGVITFTGCDIAPGKNLGDVTSALKLWTTFVTEMGSVRGMWVLRRAYGSGDYASDFKWINSFPNLAALGADYDRFRTRGGGKSRELFGDIFKCGATTVYSSQTKRIGIIDEQYKIN
jgi:hypothetical protein